MKITMTIDQDGIRYVLGSSMGAWLKSKERGVKCGEVRYIAGTLMRAYLHKPSFFHKKEIWWVPVDHSKPDYSKLEEFKLKLLRGTYEY